MSRPRSPGLEMLPAGIYVSDSTKAYVRRDRLPDGRIQKRVVAPADLTPDQASELIDSKALIKQRTVGWLMRWYVREQPEQYRIIDIEMMRATYNMRSSIGSLGATPLSQCSQETMVEALTNFRPASKRRQAVVQMTWLYKVFALAIEHGIKPVRYNYPLGALSNVKWVSEV